jgi:hypothetical protein
MLIHPSHLQSTDDKLSHPGNQTQKQTRTYESKKNGKNLSEDGLRNKRGMSNRTYHHR